MFTQNNDSNSTYRQYLSAFWENINQIALEKYHRDAPKSEVRQTTERLLPAVMRLANQGNGQAQYYLSQYLKSEHNEIYDVWLQAAADNGYIDAIYEIAQKLIKNGEYTQAEPYMLQVLEGADKYKTDLVMSHLNKSNTLENYPKVAAHLSKKALNANAYISCVKGGQTLFGCHQPSQEIDKPDLAVMISA